MRKFKSVIYGTLPYYFCLLFRPRAGGLPYFKYIHEKGYAHHLYFFQHEYYDFKVEVADDADKGLWYVCHKGKKLYFPKDRTREKVAGLYKALVMEQDSRSPHCYMRGPEEVRDRVFLDIGAAEGMIALEVVEQAKAVVLFECEMEWIKALQATFEPWKEKVTIVNRYIGSQNTEKCQTLDDFLCSKPEEPLFLKMDIEGMEREALKGAKGLFISAKNLKFAICAYHLRDDEKVIASFLKKCRIPFHIQRGYVNKRVRAVMFRDGRKD